MNNQHFYVVCFSKAHFPELVFGKIYKALEDEKGKASGLIRVFDESEEDFLYPQKWFKMIELSQEMEEALTATG